MRRLTRFPDSRINWRNVVLAVEDMRRRGVLALADLGHTTKPGDGLPCPQRDEHGVSSSARAD